MTHHLVRTGYAALSDRLNRFPQGAPPTALLFKILQVLFREQEAALVALLPIRPFTVDQAARTWRIKTTAAQGILDELAGRALLLDMEENGLQTYVLPPPMAGFFEFSMMRVRGDVDQQALSELFYQYLNVEEDFIKALFTEGDTQLGRVFVQEAALPREVHLRFWTSNGRAMSSRPPRTGGSASATAATRWRTSDAAVRRLSRSA
jgi:hypothetical protein